MHRSPSQCSDAEDSSIFCLKTEHTLQCDMQKLHCETPCGCKSDRQWTGDHAKTVYLQRLHNMMHRRAKRRKKAHPKKTYRQRVSNSPPRLGVQRAVCAGLPRQIVSQQGIRYIRFVHIQQFPRDPAFMHVAVSLRSRRPCIAAQQV